MGDIQAWNNRLKAASSARVKGRPIWFRRASFARYTTKPKFHVFKDRVLVTGHGEYKWSALCGYEWVFPELMEQPLLRTGSALPPVIERCTKCEKKRLANGYSNQAR